MVLLRARVAAKEAEPGALMVCNFSEMVFSTLEDVVFWVTLDLQHQLSHTNIDSVAL